MLPLKDFNNDKIKIVFTDIDDTLTKNGLLQDCAFSAIWKLREAGLHVVPVTGRPAGWCELIARQWPVAGVIGENGALYFRYANKKMQRKFVVNEKQQLENRSKLEGIKTEILKRVSGAAVASDQFCRLMDLAIDFCEDVTPLSDKEIDEIVEIFQAHGAQAKVSSIHVNGWFGSYNKLSMCKVFLSEVLAMEFQKSQAEIAFVGDSPNDEPLFASFENSFAVANINNQIERLQHKPNFICQNFHGEGFSEVCQRILELQS